MSDLAFKQKIKLEYLFGYRDPLEEQGYNVNMLFKSETLNISPTNHHHKGKVLVWNY